VLEITYPDGRTGVERLAVAAREWDVQRIDGLPPQQVTPDEAALVRIRREGALINEARGTDSPAEDFRRGFVWPVTGRITGIYGSQRILNGQPRQPHLGIDIAAPTGTAVVAAAPGTVTLAEPDLFFTGGTVILDHGHGLSTVYSHLDAVEVRVGERLDQGGRLGTVGATGRVTGPHLDWRVNWFQTRVDPAQLVGPMPSP
jgi:murein DD-endopeptidase MepM/ murein hydrolase activator NlpD